MYNLVANNLDINTSRTFFTKNNNKLLLFDTTFVDIYNLDIELKDSII